MIAGLGRGIAYVASTTEPCGAGAWDVAGASPHNSASITADQLRQRAEAVKAAANLGSRHREAVACVCEFVLSAKWESLPCGATAHVAEGNCVAASVGVGRGERGGEQPEANG